MTQHILLLITLLLFQLGQLGRISFFNQHLNVYVYELSMCLFVFSLFLKYSFKPLVKLWRVDKSFFLFIFVLLTSFIYRISYFSLGENSIGVAYFIRLLLYLVFGIYTFYHFQTDKKHIAKRENFLVFTSIGIIVTSLIQYFLYPDLRNLLYAGWDPHLYRLFGVFFDSSISASVFGLLLLFFLTHNFKSKVVNKNKIFVVVIFITLLILTFSRNVIISLFITIIPLFFLRKKPYLIIFFLLLIVLVYLVTPKSWGEGVNIKRTFSIQSRMNDYTSGLDMWGKAPLLGIGYNRIRYEREHLNLETISDSSHAGASFHSSYLIILVTSGLFGLLALLFMQYSIWNKITVSGYYMLYISFASLGDNILLHPFILFLLCILIGITRKEKTITHL